MLLQRRHAPASGRWPGAGRGDALVATAVKAKSARQVCCSKTLVAKPEHRERVQQLCQQAEEFSKRRIAERGSGVQDFAVVADVGEAAVLHLWERYESNAAMGRHNTSPEIKEFMEQVAPLLERPVGMALYEYRNGQIGGIAMQGGPKGEGGLDDATGASGAAGGASYKQTSRVALLNGLEEEAEGQDTEGAQQQRRQPQAGGAWWSWAGSEAAAAACLVGAAAAAAAVAMRLTGH